MLFFMLYTFCFCFSPLPQGVNSIYVEIYDECSFMMDELIAWAHIPIGKNVLNGETTEDWYPLNGKQGEGREGMINLVLSYTVFPNILIILNVKIKLLYRFFLLLFMEIMI